MTTSPTRSRVPPEERVFSLVLALVASPYGLTRAELLSSVYGYADRYEAGSVTAAVERQFERDKEQLKQLGVPLETIDAPNAPGDNRLTRYRISKDRLQLPATLRFTPDELAVLRLGALAWSEGSLGDQSRWARMRLTSLTGAPDVSALGIAPQISIAEPSATHLHQAIAERRVVTFDYQLPHRESPLRRRVAPLRLHRAHGRWHLIGEDLDRGEARVFLLSRIHSPVRLESERFGEALFEQVEAVIEQLLSLASSQRVRVSVRRGSTAESRLLARSEEAVPGADGELMLEFGTLDLHALADELVGFGDEVTVTAPSALRELLLTRVRWLQQQHLITTREARDA